MTTVQNLLVARSEIEAQLATKKMEGVIAVAALMEQFGLAWADLGVVPLGQAAVLPVAGKRKVQYRDERGNAWAGVGQRPRWLVARLLEGASIEQFKVRET